MLEGKTPDKQHPEADEEYDAVVVGSGFGGSVAAYRLAEAGLRVCLFERGRRYPPGSFPRSASELSRSVWDPSEGLHGLFDLWSFRRTDALVSAGLGGGSLIYANVLLRMPETWFFSQIPGQRAVPWPVSYADLDPHYRAVETMLDPQRYPDEYAAVTPKPGRFAAAAEQAGFTADRPPLAISFGPPNQPYVIDDGTQNLHGVPRISCRRSGQCDAGCNNGAKNTLDLTYLSRIGPSAEIFTDCEVKTFRREGSRWEIGYVHHEPPTVQQVRAGKPAIRRVRARALVLSAGTFGTNYLLLKNRASLPSLSDRIGQGFSGNGDFLGFLTRGSGTVAPANGPVITSTIHSPDFADTGSGPRPPGAPLGHYLQDGGYPGLLEWLTELTPPTGLLRRGGSLALTRARQAVTGGSPANVSKKVAVLLNEGRQSGNIMPLLAMGRDAPDSSMSLKRGFLDLEQGSASTEYVTQVRETMKKLATELGATYHDYMSAAFSRFITVHPLGGAAMAANPGEGVVDGHGRVFGYEHDHLLVLDGSILPGPVGPNPSLTIAALADRSSLALADELSASRTVAA